MWKMLIEDGKENVMGKIEGIKIKNYGPIREVVLGRTLSHQKPEPLGNMITIIGPSGNGKSTLADAFGFIADCLELGLEAACDANNRGGYDQLISQGVKEPISFEIYYRENKNTTPITYELEIDKDKYERPYVKMERLRYRNQKIGRPLSFLYLQNGVGYAFEGKKGGQDEQGNEIDHSKAAACGLSLGADGSVEGIDVFFRIAAPQGYIAVCHGVGFLCLAVSTGTDQKNQGMFKRVIGIKKCGVSFLILPGDKSCIFFQFFVQTCLLRLDFLYQFNHCSVICRYNVGQGQPVNIHHRAADILQPCFADHVLIDDNSCIGINVMYTECCKDIGQQGNQP